MGNQDYSCSYDHPNKIDFKGKLIEQGATVVQVACGMAATLFVCDDERLFGVGTPNTYRQRWNDSYSMQKVFSEIKKPANCVDYLKVCASASQRLILTKTGELFCQGENMRLYIDPEVPKEKATLDFVDCTEVFPIEDGDQIVDVAAGYFYTIVVTEQGNAYAVGCDKYRSYYTHIEGILDRKPAYQIELPGRAIKCWASKSSSNGYILVEEDSGQTKVYSGTEFVDQYECSILQLQGQGMLDRRYGEQD